MRPVRTLARLGDEETIWAVANVLRRWIERYGVPLALYTDWKSVYVREPNAEERVTGAVALTQFGRMCASLGIQIIAARSPQAKGRDERNHGTHQDRLVKKLRRLGIADAPAANAFLEMTYLPEHNARCAQAPVSTEDFHRRTPSRPTLDRVLQLEETRVLSNDRVIRYDTRYFRVARQSQQAPARSTVMVRENARGAIEIRYRDRLIQWTEIAAPAKPCRPRGERRRPPPRIGPLGRARTIRGGATPGRSIVSAPGLGRPSREEPVEADAAVDAQNAPTVLGKPPERVLHKLPQAVSLVQKGLSIAKNGTFLLRFQGSR